MIFLPQNDAAFEITEPEHARIRLHYERAIDWLVHHFGGTPVIAATFPSGLGSEPVYHKRFDRRTQDDCHDRRAHLDGEPPLRPSRRT